MRRLTWKNEAEQTCVLTIEDERNDTVDMAPGGEPFMTSIQQTTEFFTPIRTASGYVRVEVEGVDDVADLVGSAPLRRAVELQVEGVVRWRGFLACESFTQAWDVKPSLELPVMSPLEASRGVRPSADIDKLGYISFAKFLCDLNSELGEPYDNFYFPTISEPSTTMKYLFTMQNYATATDKNTAHEMSDYYSILEDICKLFGWQCIEWETSLVFMAGDVKALETGGNNFRGYTSARLAQLAAGTNDDPTDTPAFTPTTPVIYGADHRMTYMAGKKSVEAVGDMNERDETIWSMDVVGQCVYKGSDAQENVGSVYSYYYYIKKYGAYQGDGATFPNGNILAYNSLYSMVYPDLDGNNLKYYNDTHSGGDAYGGSVAYERSYFFDEGAQKVYQGSDEWKKILIMKANPGSEYIAFRIHTNFHYSPTQNKAVDAFKIAGTVLYTDTSQGFFDKPSGIHYLRAILKLNGETPAYWNPASGWSTTASDFLILANDGEIVSFGYFSSGLGRFYPQIPVPDGYSGEVMLIIYADKSPSGSSWPGTGYVALSDLEIKLVAEKDVAGQPNIEDKEQRENENKKRVNFSNGFTETWGQDCGLTLAREAMPDSYGVVLASDRTLPPNLYDGKWPEDAMADRAAAYFSKARLKIEAIVESVGKMLSPLVPYWFVQDGKQYICIEQQQNWRSNEVSAGFFEPTYEDE